MVCADAAVSAPAQGTQVTVVAQAFGHAAILSRLAVCTGRLERKYSNAHIVFSICSNLSGYEVSSATQSPAADAPERECARRHARLEF